MELLSCGVVLWSSGVVELYSCGFVYLRICIRVEEWSCGVVCVCIRIVVGLYRLWSCIVVELSMC